MIVDKFLTRRGWRIVAHAMLAGSGIGFIYLLSRMILAGIRQGYQLNLWILGVGVALSLWAVALGSMLAKSELTDRK
ncbi:MAG: hypothetical protein JW732_09050 [Dehalococcoidia bacterium]|nr:hypothetical protein [Dehalococcoidia bacterium]